MTHGSTCARRPIRTKSATGQARATDPGRAPAAKLEARNDGGERCDCVLSVRRSSDGARICANDAVDWLQIMHRYQHAKSGDSDASNSSNQSSKCVIECNNNPPGWKSFRPSYSGPEAAILTIGVIGSGIDSSVGRMADPSDNGWAIRPTILCNDRIYAAERHRSSFRSSSYQSIVSRSPSCRCVSA